MVQIIDARGLGGNGVALDQFVIQGFEDYNDGGATQNLTSGSFIDLTNDGTGAFTNTTYKLPISTNIWDTTADEFNWLDGGLVLGDTVDIRFDLVVTAGSANTEIAFRLDMAHGHANEYPLEIDRRVLSSVSATQIVRFFSIYMGDSQTLNNPAKVSMFCDSMNSSVVVNGWYIRSVPRNGVPV